MTATMVIGAGRELRVVAVIVEAGDDFCSADGIGAGIGVDFFSMSDFAEVSAPATPWSAALEMEAAEGSLHSRAVHGEPGRSGILQTGRTSINAGIARCPITAAVHTACLDAAERLRSEYTAAAATITSSAPLSAASRRTGIALCIAK